MGTLAPDSPGVGDTGLTSDDPAAPGGSDDDVEDDCVESSTAFDIEQVSALQDAFGLPQVRDGLTLHIDEESLGSDRTWRPVSVQVLVMYPEWYFEYYDDSNSLAVNFHPTATPSASSAFTRTIQVRKADLDWSPLTLPADADWSGDDRQQMAAWLEFDLSAIVPESGFTTTDYFVSLSWDGMGFPNVGYSNFELNCAQNWTDYGVGSYVQNSGQDCSWPMMKIEIETLSPGDC
jgi:hypothetical protein